MYKIIDETIKRAESSGNIGHALVYQCLLTILRIYPNDQLLEHVSRSITWFFSSDSRNLNYIGIIGLIELVKRDKKYAAQHQDKVIQCLEDPDLTLKTKTLELLVKMTNKDNAEAIVDKLMENLKTLPPDSKVKKELVGNIHHLVNKFSPNKTWFVRTMNLLFQQGGDLITPEITNKFIKDVSRKIDKEKFRNSTVKIYKNILKKQQNIGD